MQCDCIQCTCQSLQDTVYDNTPLCYTYRALSVSIVLQVRIPGIVYEYSSLGRKGKSDQG